MVNQRRRSRHYLGSSPLSCARYYPAKMHASHGSGLIARVPGPSRPASFVHAGSGARHIAARFAGGVGLCGQGDGRAEGGPPAARLGHAPLAAAPEEGPRLRRLTPQKALGARQLR